MENMPKRCCKCFQFIPEGEPYAWVLGSYIVMCANCMSFKTLDEITGSDWDDYEEQNEQE